MYRIQEETQSSREVNVNRFLLKNGEQKVKVTTHCAVAVQKNGGAG